MGKVKTMRSCNSEGEEALRVRGNTEEIDIVKECLRKRGLDVGQARKIVEHMSQLRGFVRGHAWGVPQRMNP